MGWLPPASLRSVRRPRSPSRKSVPKPGHRARRAAAVGNEPDDPGVLASSPPLPVGQVRGGVEFPVRGPGLSVFSVASGALSEENPFPRVRRCARGGRQHANQRGTEYRPHRRAEESSETVSHVIFDARWRTGTTSRRTTFRAIYVDTQCIDCDVCRVTAPANFTRQEDKGYSYVFEAAGNAEEEAQCQEAMDSCPVEAIGNNGE